jgi:hypothetical protein
MSAKLFGRVFDTPISACAIDVKAKHKRGGKKTNRVISGAAQKMVLLFFADKSNDYGEGIYPSIDTIAKKTGMAESNVSFVLQALSKQGYIKKIGLSKYGTSDYVMNTSLLAEVTDDSLPSLRGTKKTASPQGGEPLPSLRGTPPLPEVYNPQLNPQLNPPQPVVVVNEWGQGVFESIRFSNNKKKELASARPENFVAAYLYSAAQKIDSPMGLAIKLTLERGERGMGQPYETLAALGPAKLADVLAWLRDGCAYSLNGTMDLALAYRGLLTDKKPHALIATRALNELGLEHFAKSQIEDLRAYGALPPVEATQLDEWQTAINTLLIANKDAREKFLASSHLIRREGKQYIVGVDKHFHSWLSTGRVPKELRELNIEWVAE